MSRVDVEESLIDMVASPIKLQNIESLIFRFTFPSLLFIYPLSLLKSRTPQSSRTSSGPMSIVDARRVCLGSTTQISFFVFQDRRAGEKHTRGMLQHLGLFPPVAQMAVNLAMVVGTLGAVAVSISLEQGWGAMGSYEERS
jgi:hypothetical protein